MLVFRHIDWLAVRWPQPRIHKWNCALFLSRCRSSPLLPRFSHFSTCVEKRNNFIRCGRNFASTTHRSYSAILSICTEVVNIHAFASKHMLRAHFIPLYSKTLRPQVCWSNRKEFYHNFAAALCERTFWLFGACRCRTQIYFEIKFHARGGLHVCGERVVECYCSFYSKVDSF